MNLAMSPARTRRSQNRCRTRAIWPCIRPPSPSRSCLSNSRDPLGAHRRGCFLKFGKRNGAMRRPHKRGRARISDNEEAILFSSDERRLNRRLLAVHPALQEFRRSQFFLHEHLQHTSSSQKPERNHQFGPCLRVRLRSTIVSGRNPVRSYASRRASGSSPAGGRWGLKLDGPVTPIPEREQGKRRKEQRGVKKATSSMMQLSYYDGLTRDNVPTSQIRALHSRGAFSPTVSQRTFSAQNLQSPFPGPRLNDWASATTHERGTNAPFEISGRRHCA
jgi:hypothetical protein